MGSNERRGIERDDSDERLHLRHVPLPPVLRARVPAAQGPALILKIRLRDRAARPHAVGYVGVCDQEEGVVKRVGSSVEIDRERVPPVLRARVPVECSGAHTKQRPPRTLQGGSGKALGGGGYFLGVRNPCRVER